MKPWVKLAGHYLAWVIVCWILQCVGATVPENTLAYLILAPAVLTITTLIAFRFFWKHCNRPVWGTSYFIMVVGMGAGPMAHLVPLTLEPFFLLGGLVGMVVFFVTLLVFE